MIGFVRALARGGLVLALWACTPTTLRAQWIESPGSGWADLTVYRHDTRTQFGRDRSSEPIPNGGHAVATSLFVTGALGILRGVDAWIQVPVHHLRYDDFAADRTSSGFGDPRTFLRIGPEFLGLPPVPVAIRGGVKWPGGSFDVDAEVIPLGEGQRDLEVLVEVGRSFYPRPLWAAGWVGVRWRGPNRATARDPGNERFWYAAVGGTGLPVPRSTPRAGTGGTGDTDAHRGPEPSDRTCPVPAVFSSLAESSQVDPMTTSGGLDRTFREEALPHLSAVYRFALRLAGDPERAQDLTQETFLRAYRGFEGYSAGTNAKSWLFTICRNTFLREEERGRRHEQIVRAEAEGDPRALSREAVVFKAAQELDPEGTFWSRIVDEELVREIDSLPAGFREAVVLSDVEGLSYQEMAELMEVPVGTVKSRLFRGRRILQERLYEYAVSTGRIEKRTDAPPGNPEGKCR